MPTDFHDCFQIVSSGNQERRSRMPEIVEADSPYPRFRHIFVKEAVYEDFMTNGATISGMGEQIPVFWDFLVFYNRFS